MALTKTTRPPLSDIFPRKRFFRELDLDRTRPVTWVQGPAGAMRLRMARLSPERRQK
jgi:hypothetical protein